MKFMVVEVEDLDEDLVVRMASLNDKGEVNLSRDGWYIELWRPKSPLLNVREGQLFDVKFTPLKETGK